MLCLKSLNDPQYSTLHTNKSPSLAAVVVTAIVVVAEVSRASSRSRGLHIICEVMSMLQKQVFEHAQFFAEQFYFGLQSLILLLELIYTLLGVLCLLLATHAAFLYCQIVAFSSLAVFLTVFLCHVLLHLAGWCGLSPTCGTHWD